LDNKVFPELTMKRYALMIALASVAAAPCYAQLAGETNVMKTETAVERAAREQGFSSSIGSGAAAPAPQVIENTSVMMMAPEAPASAAQPAQSGMPQTSYGGSRPSLIKDGLPAGLVMDGPGTEAYKKKHRKKKKKKAAVEQAAPSEPSAKPAPAPAPEEPKPAEPPKEEPAPDPAPDFAAPVEEPPVMPDVTAPSPVDPMPEPEPDLGMPAPEAPPGGLEPPDDPFATPPGQ
jgi:hypothetical protein